MAVLSGVVAAGHPLTAQAGARVLREGGNAVDGALAAMLVSWVAEPLLTGPGAGGYLLVAGAGEEPVVLDFFVAAPGCGERAAPGELRRVEVSFEDAVQAFHVGAASAGAYGTPAGIEAAARRWGSVPLDQLAAPASALAREGVEVNAIQAYLFDILAPIYRSAPEGKAAFAPGGELLRAGDRLALPELADTIERLGAEGAAPFYTGDLADAVVDCLGPRGAVLTRDDLAAYAAQPREPVHATYRGHAVHTNPPPAAGGTLLALAMARLEELREGAPTLTQIVEVMEHAQAQRTPHFLERLGSTTHIAVVDADGRACSVTCTNGEGCGIVVPGTGIHVNNIMGEEDLSPLGFHRAAPGTRMPSMMAPTAVLAPDGALRLVLGSAGSNRIRSAILQVIVGVLDHGLDVDTAVRAPRVHVEGASVYAEPGVPVEELGDRDLVRFRAPNVFFGGAQAVERDPATGALRGAGDPRRGGAVVVA
ncbi:MAG: gamma-glutamyltransferase [Actinomycetota bacterium]|nr:gamma-glutamyltransferase [Actinomycetota bacterium]